MTKPFTLPIAELSINDIPEVGGKNASLGEMLQNLKPQGVNIPDGFVVTATAYRHFIAEGRVRVSKSKELSLKEFIASTLSGLNTKDLKGLHTRGEAIRKAIRSAQFPADLAKEIGEGYKAMEKQYGKNVDVAVRSSATAEDLPGASFAGQQETYLNIHGAPNLIKAVQNCCASLFTDRAISYRHDKGFDHDEIALSVGIQKMVRSDMGASGVMFTLDTESGFKDVVLVSGVWGLGEMIVQGEVAPDEFLVFRPAMQQGAKDPIISKALGAKDRKMIYATAGAKPTKIVPVAPKDRVKFVITDEEVLTLAKWGVLIEEHYTKVHGKWTPMDIEWAKDGKTGKLFIVQARPETVQSQKDYSKVMEYELLEQGASITKGASVGSKIASGASRVIMDAKDMYKFKKGEVLVTDMTDPDWEPIMKIASAIVTDKGGRTSHAAIVSRELGIPCVVGCGNATRAIKAGETVTVDTTGSEGYVLKGALKFAVHEHDVKNLPELPVKIMMNIATPETAFEKSFLPNAGVGLAREEFIIASNIGIHPMALINYANLKKGIHNGKKAAGKEAAEIKKIVAAIDKKTDGYADKAAYYVDQLAYGIAKIGAAFFPKPVIVRFSDFKTNEYRMLTGGSLYEPHEENPMIGWRGASRYYHEAFKDAFVLELEAFKKVRTAMGLTNVQAMVPFCRTPEEGRKVMDLIEEHGLKEDGMKVYVMCEIPSNIMRADAFLDVFDGMSIGSNDLTQLTLGIDRDGNERIRSIANETDESVKALIGTIIEKCRARGKYIGICGQAPSDIPEFAAFLMEKGIQSMSLNPDSVVRTIMALGKEK
jgi:pyruvate,water dikinase